MIQELQNKTYRINFRSSGNVIINDIAQSFGGGGHKFAAGALSDIQNLDYIANKILQLVKDKIKDKNVN